jgi:hypothetical protein
LSRRSIAVEGYNSIIARALRALTCGAGNLAGSRLSGGSFLRSNIIYLQEIYHIHRLCGN